MRDALRRFSLERALQLAIAATIVSAVLAAGALLSWLGPARKARWVALLALVVVALVYAYRHGAGRKPNHAYAAALAFLILAAASVGWSAHPSLTVARTGALALLFAACGALAHATAGRPEAISGVLHGVLAGTGAVAVGGLLVLLFEHDRAIAPATTSLAARYQGLGGGPDTATMVLAVGVPVGAYALVDARSALGRAGAATLLALFLGSIVASGSRGALVSAFGGLLAFSLLAVRAWRPRGLAAAAVVVLFALSIAVMRLPDPAEAAPPPPPPAAPGPDDVPSAAPGYVDANDVLRLQDDVGRPPPGVGDTKRRTRTLLGTSGRAEAWRGALGQGGERPLLGHGFGTEDRVFVDRYVNFNSNSIENSYIGLFLQLGLAGLAAFLALVGVLLAPAARAFGRLAPPELRVAAACAGALVVGLVLACFQSYIYAVGNNATAAVWICAFLLAAATTTQHVSPGRR